MKVTHITDFMLETSGISTFVRELDFALQEAGVSSCIYTEETGLPESFDCDVVHLHGMWRPIFHKAVGMAKKAGIPIVWSSHGTLSPVAMAHKRWKKLVPWYLYQKKDLESAAVMHATVEQEAEWIRNLGFKQPIVIAPLGTKLPRKALEPKFRGVARKTLLFVGRIHPIKALGQLIEAFVKASVDDWKLRIVGPDEIGYKAELEKLAEQLKVQGLKFKVEFAGPKFGAELEAEYENCDCLALVSHTENFGATVVDAMAHGKPVITSTKTPWKEVADLGCGWWVDNDIETLAATLRSTLNTPTSTLEAMGKRGRKLVEEKYTWPAVANTMLNCYKELCHES